MNSSKRPKPRDLEPHGGFLFDHLGMKFSFSEDGAVVGQIKLEDHHFSWPGRVHAGTVFALADSCAGFGCLKTLPDGASGFATLETKTNFIATTDEGGIIAYAHPVHLGRSTQTWDVEVLSEKDDRKMALFRCTQMILWPEK
ncbi:MAG: PaaI family thioesterase [Proteobacteria bacterium]|mgnify:FL=1|nr:PaaI family thioesterase [Pseudomonadota bacterium]MDB4827427.1 PaaI family thioesterase [Gammaproteobacteria bacterium]MBT4107504.1 PaaI family thioesterase [Pseudomonadota bacterium]MBT4358109.1 PaaI family thioesterase [Pseudomonadota bacterium]MBT4986319.1 PaaI family thioesterase [Pseudomonadota bacterium]